MPTDVRDEIRSRLDIVDVIGKYVRLQKSGREFKGLCPFHEEKSASFTVSPTRQVWYCFGCSEGGDLFAFVQKIERVDFRGALEILADAAGVEYTPDRTAPHESRNERDRLIALQLSAQAFYEHILWNLEPGGVGRALLKDREVSQELATHFGIGFAPAGGDDGDALIRYLHQKLKATDAELLSAGLATPSQRGGIRDKFRHRLVFPIRDDRGTTIGFGGRAIGDGIPKYLNSPETPLYHKSSTLFGLDLAKESARATNTLMLVEGYFDVVAFHKAGIPNVVASSGTALTEGHVRLLKRYVSMVYLCFDGDTAGRAATERATELLARGEIETKVMTLPDGAKDPDEAIRHDPQALARSIEAAGDAWETVLDRAIGTDSDGPLEARKHAIERALGVIARMPDETGQELYMELLSQKLKIPVVALRHDLRNRFRLETHGVPGTVYTPHHADPPPPTDTGDGDHAQLPEVDPMSPAEESTAALLVQHPVLATEFQAKYEITDEDHELFRALMESIEHRETGAEFAIESVDVRFHPLIARLLLRELPLSDLSAPVTRSKILDDCIRSLKQAVIRRRIILLQEQLKRVQQEGDSQKLSETVHAIHSASKALQTLKETKSA